MSWIRKRRVRDQRFPASPGRLPPKRIGLQWLARGFARRRSNSLPDVTRDCPIPIVRISNDRRLVDANDAARAAFDGICVRPGGRLTEELAQPAERAASEGRTVTAEVSCGARVFLMTFCPHEHEVKAFGCDITDQKNTEISLRASNEVEERDLAKLDALISQMTEGLVVFEPDGTLIDMNPAALAIHGFDNVDQLKRRHSELPDLFEIRDLDGRLLPLSEWPIGRVLAGETFDSYEVHVRRTDGTREWIGSYGGTPVYDKKGTLLLAIVTLRDVTEHKAIEEELRMRRDELEDRVQARTAELQRRADQLARLSSQLTLTEQRERRRLAQLLHDHLQQLLVGAKFGLDVIGRRAVDDQKQSVLEVKDLVNEAINASRSLTMELSPPILHDAGLGAALDWLIRWMGERYGLDVDLSVDPNATTDREDVRVLLFYSARELLFNVIKHARVTRASVALRRLDEESLSLAVRDDGAGFDPDSELEAEDIDGFGLFSIRERLALIGGELTIDSAIGRGSTFTLVAPIHTEEGAAAGEVRSRSGEVSRDGATISILLVDDHAVLRQGMRLLLSEEPDMEVVGEASDGEEAVAMAADVGPDVVLMDFSMPKMDGVQATTEIANRQPQIRVIGLSMYDEADRAQAMIDAGAVAYVTKSGNPEVLLATIREAYANRVGQVTKGK